MVITNFLDGRDGQVIHVFSPNTIGTIDHNANIKNAAGSARAIDGERFYMYIMYNGVWYQAGV